MPFSIFVIMRKILFTLFALISGISAQAQRAKGELSSTRVVNLDIMRVFPSKLPEVSLVFRAEDLDGKPVWDLEKEHLIVEEKGKPCEITSLEPISKNTPINVGIVIDHSGSMGFDLYSYFDVWRVIRGQRDTIIPLEYARRSATTFVNSFDTKKDKMSVVGFGSIVDLKIPLTKDTAHLNKSIRNIELDGSTAFYDAMMAGMKQLKNKRSIRALIAMTDGRENASSANWQNVVDYSNKEEIPLYVIGLGTVDKDTLRHMAEATNGHFYHTTKSSSLVNIYKDISEQLQAFYVVDYKSPTVEKMDRKNKVKISFDVNTNLLVNDPTNPEVIAYLEQRAFDQKLRSYGEISVYIIGGLSVISLMYWRRKKKKQRKKNQQGK